ncbi:hypothetical protein [Microbaculum marinum]|uniref:Uncharacterized protein n=1 Tax=Microbaculum marinum TaxID=1764581 RepID=A0AAW9RVU1_9HYPH
MTSPEDFAIRPETARAATGSSPRRFGLPTAGRLMTAGTEAHRAMQNWAVVCGAIRSPLEFTITLNAILKLRDQGLLHGIVVATWSDAFRETPELRSDLIRRNIAVVEVPQMREGGNGQTFRQHRLFQAGAMQCPDGVAILKMRSDKAVHRLHFFIDRLKAGPAPVSAAPSMFRSMTRRISIQAASVSMPFNHSDIVFYGLKGDLLRLSHMDQMYDWTFFPGSMNAEIRWFSRPFLFQLNVFRQYFELFNCRAMSRHVIDMVEGGRFDAIPEVVLDAIAANIVCIHENFEIVSPDRYDGVATVRQLFGFDDSKIANVIPMTMTKHVACYSNAAVAAAAHGQFPSNNGGDHLKAAFARMADPVHAERNISDEEIRKIGSTWFPDSPLNGSKDSMLRIATCVREPLDMVDAPLDIHLEPDTSGRQMPEERAFVQEYLAGHCHEIDLATLYFNLSEMFRNGDSVQPDEGRARYWLHLSAEARHRPAETAWADLLKQDGDLEGAAGWYRKAALRGDQAAQRELALLLRDHPITSVSDSWEDWMELAGQGTGTPELPA